MKIGRIELAGAEYRIAHPRWAYVLYFLTPHQITRHIPPVRAPCGKDGEAIPLKS
jgi:hypothetical protein